MRRAVWGTDVNYIVEESNDQVKGIEPDLRTRFRGRAERRARNLNAKRLWPYTYHWKVVAIIGTGRYEVRAFQNYARSL